MSGIEFSKGGQNTERKTYRKFGAGYPWAGHINETEVLRSMTVGRPLTIDSFGEVVDMGSEGSNYIEEGC